MSATWSRGDTVGATPPGAAVSLESRLAQASGRRVRLVLTHNRSSMLSVRFAIDGGVRLRLDHGFLQMPGHVLDALGRYLRLRRREDWRVVAHFAGGLVPAARPAAPGQVRTHGRFHDLALIRDEVNRTYFQGRLDCRIGWGTLGHRRRRTRSRSIRYGSYVRAQDLVRINPLLDDPRVPADFVAYIVYHEMLHAVVPSEQGARRRHHHAVYRHLERRFPDYQRMQRLSAELVQVLVG